MIKIDTLYCGTCKTMITSECWQMIFGDRQMVMYSSAELVPHYECGCDGAGCGGRVYFKGTFTKAQLEASKDDRKAFGTLADFKVGF